MPDNSTEEQVTRGRGRPIKTADEEPAKRTDAVVYMRVPLPLMSRVIAHHEALTRSAATGVRVSQAAAIHNLLERGLEAVGADVVRTPKAAPKAARRRA